MILIGAPPNAARRNRKRKEKITMFKNKLMVIFLREVAVNSLLIGVLPLFAAVVFQLFKDDLRLINQAAEWAPSPWMTGMAVLLVGLNVSLSLVQRPSLRLEPGEEIVEMRRPSLKPPFARIAIGVLLAAAGGVWLWYAPTPYVYPLALLAVGMCAYSLGVITCWMNRRVAYYVTNLRVVRMMYKFSVLHTTGIPIGAVVSMSAARSPIEMLTGTGNARVEGARLKLRMKEIDNPEPVARTIGEMVMLARSNS